MYFRVVIIGTLTDIHQILNAGIFVYFFERKNVCKYYFYELSNLFIIKITLHEIKIKDKRYF